MTKFIDSWAAYSIAGVFSMIAITLSVMLIRSHLRHYSKPILQKPTIRILLILQAIDEFWLRLTGVALQSYLRDLLVGLACLAIGRSVHGRHSRRELSLTVSVLATFMLQIYEALVIHHFLNLVRACKSHNISAAMALRSSASVAATLRARAI